jgi:hypothetical protein
MRAARKQRQFEESYGMTAQEAAQDLGEAPVGRNVPDIGGTENAEVRAEAAEKLKEEATRRRDAFQEQFAEQARAKFADEEQAQEAFEENAVMYDRETAREVMKNPVAYVGDKKAYADPGPVSDTSEEINTSLQQLDQAIEKQGQRAQRYADIEEMAQIQSGTQDRLWPTEGEEPVGEVSDERSASETDTLWSRMKKPREQTAEMSTEAAKSQLQNRVERETSVDRIDRIVTLSEQANETEALETKQARLRAATELPESDGQVARDTAKQKAAEADQALRDQLKSAYTEVAEGEEAERRAQEAYETLKTATRDENLGAGIRQLSDVDGPTPTAIEDAQQTAAANGTETAADAVIEGSDDGVLQQAGRAEIREAVAKEYGRPTDDSKATLRDVQDRYNDLKRKEMTRPRPAGYDEQIREEVAQMDETTRERLQTQARNDEQVAEALSRAETAAQRDLREEVGPDRESSPQQRQRPERAASGERDAGGEEKEPDRREQDREIERGGRR